MMRNLRALAQWTKLSGTPGEMESLRYVRHLLDGYVYRTTLLMHDAYVSLPLAARAVVDGRALTAITHSMSRASPPAGVSGPLVHVGEGTRRTSPAATCMAASCSRMGCQPAWPVLDPLRDLAGAAPGTDAARLRVVGARRARNRITHAIAEAAAVLGSFADAGDRAPRARPAVR